MLAALQPAMTTGQMTTLSWTVSANRRAIAPLGMTDLPLVCGDGCVDLDCDLGRMQQRVVDQAVVNGALDSGPVLVA